MISCYSYLRHFDKYLRPKIQRSQGVGFSLQLSETQHDVIPCCSSYNGSFVSSTFLSLPHQNTRNYYRTTTSNTSSSAPIVHDNSKPSLLRRNLALEAIKEAGWKQLEDTAQLIAKNAHKSLLLQDAEDNESNKPNVRQLRLASRLLDMLENIVHDYCLRVSELYDAEGEPMIEVSFCCCCWEIMIAIICNDTIPITSFFYMLVVHCFWCILINFFVVVVIIVVVCVFFVFFFFFFLFELR